jgi:hypothetical protein
MTNETKPKALILILAGKSRALSATDERRENVTYCKF